LVPGKSRGLVYAQDCNRLGAPQPGNVGYSDDVSDGDQSALVLPGNVEEQPIAYGEVAISAPYLGLLPSLENGVKPPSIDLEVVLQDYTPF